MRLHHSYNGIRPLQSKEMQSTIEEPTSRPTSTKDDLKDDTKDDRTKTQTAATDRQPHALDDHKKVQTAALCRLSKCRNRIGALMLKTDSLQDTKRAVSDFDSLLSAYQAAHSEYIECLSKNKELADEAHKDDQRFFANECSAFDFRARVMRWIDEEETRLADELTSASSPSVSRRSKASKGSCGSRSSIRSAKAKEEAKIAELNVQSALLDQQLDLQQRKADLLIEEKKLQLTTQLEMAKARRKVFEATEQVSRAEVGVVQSPLNPEAQSFEPTELSRTPDPQLHTAPMQLPPESDEMVPQQAPLSPMPTPHPLMQQLHFETPSPLPPPPQPSLSKPSPQSQLQPSSAAPSPWQPLPQQPPHPPVSSPWQPSTQQPISMATPLVAVSSPSLPQLLATMSLPQGEVPTFAGDPTEFKLFMNAFNARIACKTSNYADLLYYLNQYLRGEARDCITGCLHMSPEAGFNEALAVLQREYGNPYRVSSAYIDRLSQWTPIKADDSHSLKSLHIFLTRTIHAMSNLPDLQILNHLHNLQMIVTKLPSYLQGKWRDYVVQLKRTPTLSDLVQFVQRASDAANDPVFGRAALAKASGSSIKSANSSNPVKKTFAINLTETQCLLCKNIHPLTTCTAFNQYSVKERHSFLKKSKLCFACFLPGHQSKSCTNKPTCSVCQKGHHTLLHMTNFQRKKKPVSDANDTNGLTEPISPSTRTNSSVPVLSNACKIVDNAVVLHPIVPVRVRYGDKDSIITYAFFDSGSSACFVSDQLVHQLGIKGSRTVLDVRTLNGSSRSPCIAVSDLIMTDYNGNNPICLPKCYSQQEIPVDHYPMPEVLRNRESLKEAVDEMPDFMPNTPVGLLIGSNCSKALQPLKVIPSEGNGPFAVRYSHGWTINGPVEVHYDSLNHVSCHRVQVSETKVKEVPMLDVLSVLNQDFSDLDDPSSLYGQTFSQEDKQFLKILESSLKHDDGHFEAPLPFKDSDVNLPLNKCVAVKRAECQKRKMIADDRYRADYVAFVDNLLEKGYARKIPPSEQAEPGKVWYLPHHGVYHPTKKKIRVVFDCSSRFHGVSLNDLLLQGPDLTNSLIGVLSRFRLEPVAIIGDIEAMFHQVKVVTHHQSFFRFLWWPHGDLNQHLHEYAMTVHLFGASSSPSIANYALKKTADLAKASFDNEVVNVIRDNFYVDDCLVSCKSEDDAVALVHNLKSACRLGGFNLGKICSNSARVLDSLDRCEKSKELQHIGR